jgi:lipopolysaccharide transport system ATP-binding protein
MVPESILFAFSVILSASRIVRHCIPFRNKDLACWSQMASIEVSKLSKRFVLQHDQPRLFQDVALRFFKHRASKGSLRHEEFWALSGVSFTVEPGESLAIIGKNGSGKSTCLKLLTRIMEPTSGFVKTRGRTSALIELGAGFHPDLTGKDNLFVNGIILGMTRTELKQRFDEIVAFAELEHFIDIPVKFYSSGMYLRLAFAIAINVNADIMLLDEVLAVGDQSFQTKCLERIAELQRNGVTIVFVSHDLNAVRTLCQRTIWLEHGKLRADGETDAVIADYSNSALT